MGLFDSFGKPKQEKLNIPTEIQAQFNLLLQSQPEIRGLLSVEQLMAFIQQAMQSAMSPDTASGEADIEQMIKEFIQQTIESAISPDAANSEADIEHMSAAECGMMGERLLRQGHWQAGRR